MNDKSKDKNRVPRSCQKHSNINRKKELEREKRNLKKENKENKCIEMDRNVYMNMCI